jgi:hypothetical protein
MRAALFILVLVACTSGPTGSADAPSPGSARARGFDEGFAANADVRRILDGKVASARADALATPEGRAMNECVIDAFYEAQEECRLRRLPNESVPAHMTAARCEHLWRHGSAGAADLRPFRGYVETCREAVARRFPGGTANLSAIPATPDPPP